MLVNVYAHNNMTGSQFKLAGPVEADRLSVDARWDSLVLDLDGFTLLVETGTPNHWQRSHDFFGPYFSSPVVMPA